MKDALIFYLEKDQSIARTCWSGTQLSMVLAVGNVDTTQAAQQYHDLPGWRYNRLDYSYLIDLLQEKFIPLSADGLERIIQLEGGD